MEVIHNLQRHNKPVRTTDVAHHFNVTPASVTEIFQKLDREGYINYTKYAGATPTKKGQKTALQTRKKHDTMKELLLHLGISEKIAEEDACKMEHLLHEETIAAAMKLIETIKKCPDSPLLLKRLQNYCKTGELIECPPEITQKCRHALQQFEDKNI